MASQTFDIGEPSKRSVFLRFLLVAILLSLISLAVLVGVWAYRTTEDWNACKSPELDPYGMSNWTIGSDTVAFGCFPGHDLEGHAGNNPIVSECVDREWVPPPPACAALPFRLDCDVNQKGLEGTVTMWQESKSTPTLIYGVLNTSGVDKGRVLSESITLSRTNCTASADMNITMPPQESTPAEDLEVGLIEIRFNSTALRAYKRATLRVNMIFLDPAKNQVASLVSLTQGELTLVMKTPFNPYRFTVTDSSDSNNVLVEGTIAGTESGLIEGTIAGTESGLIEGTIGGTESGLIEGENETERMGEGGPGDSRNETTEAEPDLDI